MKKVQRFLGVLLLVIYAASGDLVYAANYYVAKTGRDTNAGSETSPFLTINYGVSRIRAGDTLYVKAGVYDESLLYNVPSGTSWTNKVRIAANPGETVWMAPSSGDRVLAFAGNSNGGNTGEQKFIEFDGINLDGSKVLYDVVKIETGSGYNAHHIRIQNAELIGSEILTGGGLTGPQLVMLNAIVAGGQGFNEMRNLRMHHVGGSGTFGYGFYVQSSDNLIENCDISDTNGAGISVYNGYVGDLESSRNIIRNNRIHDIARSADTRIDGIMVGRGVGNQIYNNIFYNIGGSFTDTRGLYIYHGSDTGVYNNTFYGGTVYGILVETTSINATVKNNISYGHTSDYLNRGVNTIASTNLFGGNPEFVDSAAGDFQLMSGSPAVNTGGVVAIVTNDFAGTARPQGPSYDIGAYEFTLPKAGDSRSAPLAPTSLHIVP